MDSSGKLSKRDVKALQAKNARSAKVPAPTPEASSVPAATAWLSKRPRSEPDPGATDASLSKKLKAEREGVWRRDRLIDSLRDHLQQLELDLQETTSWRESLAKHNSGLLARIQALGRGLGELDARYASMEVEHTTTQFKLAEATMRADWLSCELAASQHTCHDLKTCVKELDCLKRMYAACGRRAAAKAGPPEPAIQPIFKLRTGAKAKGCLPSDVRLAILNLVTIGVGVDHIFRAVLCCAELFKISLAGTFSSASVRKIVLEAGVAGKIQLAASMDAVTALSRDWTLNYKNKTIAPHL
jgi:hypothetical protein